MLELGTKVKVLSGKYEGTILPIIGAWEVGNEARVFYTLSDNISIFIDNISEGNVEVVVSEPIQDDSGNFKV